MFPMIDIYIDPFAILALGLVLDALIGEPSAVYRVIGHPVAAMGRLIGALDARLNDETRSPESRRRRGLVVMIAIVPLHAGIGVFLTWAFVQTPFSLLLEAVVVAVLLAGRDLHDHVAKVARGLETGDLEGGREAVRHLLGRDPETLDSAGVARGAIESLAENFSDAVVAPWFWYMLFGLPGMLVYKAVNTADSMIGHRSERHREFGRAAAKLDDFLSYIPARITAGLLALAASLVPEASWRGANQAMRRDASGHQSPNAGWPEAAMAGALDLALNGPRSYGGVVSDDPWMGDGRKEATAEDIRRALRLYLHAWGLLFIITFVFLWLYR